jgi:hypothetical protein
MTNKGGGKMSQFTYEELLQLLEQLKEMLDAVGIEYLVIKCTPKKK